MTVLILEWQNSIFFKDYIQLYRQRKTKLLSCFAPPSTIQAYFYSMLIKQNFIDFQKLYIHAHVLRLEHQPSIYGKMADSALVICGRLTMKQTFSQEDNCQKDWIDVLSFHRDSKTLLKQQLPTQDKTFCVHPLYPLYHSYLSCPMRACILSYALSYLSVCH